jgi:mitogen-activated protein kinase kinase kinase 7
VKLESCWLEGGKIVIKSESLEKVQNSETVDHLYIQMEFCELNLEDFISLLISLLNGETFYFNVSRIGLYLKSEIFLEIVEGIRYLHSLKPRPIIHRDLNPRNILLKTNQNGNHIKIADFGLSVEHEKKNSNGEQRSQTHTKDVGTPKFIAPEVESGRRYNEKCDIYSLGKIFEKMFDLESLK